MVYNIPRPLGFFSRKLTEKSYAPFDKELLAIPDEVAHFSNMTEGHLLIVFTDHKPIITAYKKQTNKSPRQTRAFAFIAEFVQDIQHISGNVVADALSRIEVSSITEGELAAEQENDSELQEYKFHPSHCLFKERLTTGNHLWKVRSGDTSHQCN